MRQDGKYRSPFDRLRVAAAMYASDNRKALDGAGSGCGSYLGDGIIKCPLGRRLAVGHVTLDHVALVRIQAPQP